MPPRRSYGNQSLFTEDKHERYLECVADGWSLTKAAYEVGVSPASVRKFIKKNPEFEKRFKDAYNTGSDLLEDEAFRRAVHGVEKPVYQGGVEVGTITEYSDSLLTMLLKARLPHKYREKQVEAPPPPPLTGEAATRTLALGVIQLMEHIPGGLNRFLDGAILNGQTADREVEGPRDDEIPSDELLDPSSESGD